MTGIFQEHNDTKKYKWFMLTDLVLSELSYAMESSTLKINARENNINESVAID